jgi:hypothetical protein
VYKGPDALEEYNPSSRLIRHFSDNGVDMLPPKLRYLSMAMFLQESVDDASIVGFTTGGQISVRWTTVIANGKRIERPGGGGGSPQ